MSKGLKIFIIICAVMIVLGMIFAGVGFLMGGSANLGGFGPFSGEVVEETENLSDFSSIQMQVSLADITIAEGDDYRIEYSYYAKAGKTDVEVRDGVLYVEDRVKNRNFPIDLGWDFPQNHKSPHVRIYYPAGTEFDEVNIQSDLGDATIKDMNVQTLTVAMDLGSFDLDRVTADRADLDLDLGDLSAKDFHTNGLEAALDLGSLEMEGSFAGKTIVDCSLGDIDIKTEIPRKEYNFDVNVELGDFTLDGKDMGTIYETDSEAANFMELSCDMGEVEVTCR